MLNKIFSPFPVLITERLILRQLLESDSNEIFSLRSDININRYLERQPSKTLDDAKSFIQMISDNIRNGNSIYWAISITDNKKLVGTICLFDFSDESDKCEIGYELLTSYQGRGIMKEAMSKIIEYASDKIGVKKIDAFTHKDNHRSIKLLKKFDFKEVDNSADVNPNFLRFELAF